MAPPAAQCILDRHLQLGYPIIHEWVINRSLLTTIWPVQTCRSLIEVAGFSSVFIHFQSVTRHHRSYTVSSCLFWLYIQVISFFSSLPFARVNTNVSSLLFTHYLESFYIPRTVSSSLWFPGLRASTACPKFSKLLATGVYRSCLRLCFVSSSGIVRPNETPSQLISSINHSVTEEARSATSWGRWFISFFPLPLVPQLNFSRRDTGKITVTSLTFLTVSIMSQILWRPNWKKPVLSSVHRYIYLSPANLCD